MTVEGDHNPQESERKRKRKSRWGEAPPSSTVTTTSTPIVTGLSTADAKAAKAAELKANITARLTALKEKRTFKRQAAPEIDESVKKAKVFDLDLTQIKPTFQEPATPPKPKVNPYLAHGDDNDEADEILLDSRLAGGHTAKRRVRSKPLKFVEPGTFIEIAERKRLKAALAAKSGFASGRKEGLYVKSAGIAQGVVGDDALIYGTTQAGQGLATEGLLQPRIDEDPSYTLVPIAMEWWDAELLPSKLKMELASKETKLLKNLNKKRVMDVESVTSAIISNKPIINPEGAATDTHEPPGSLFERCFQAASIKYSKTSKLVQHPPPIETPQTKLQKPTPTLFLTKQEMKRQRKLRRAEKQREQQDLQAAGLIPAPEPRLTLSNFMKVLGDQAVMDPSKMEQTVLKQMQARKLKHEQMNAERQLTKEEKSLKRFKKFHEDTTSTGIHVALFYVKDMSHRYHRTKVDLNAQQNGVTGGVLECELPPMALIVAEAGPKAIKRYIRLMTVRMKWRGENDLAGADQDESETDHDALKAANDTSMKQYEDDPNEPQKFNPNNSCQLVWTGMSNKRIFNGFFFQSCVNSDTARKVLAAKGVAHYWDQVLTFSKSNNSSDPALQFKLVSNSNHDDNADEMQD